MPIRIQQGSIHSRWLQAKQGEMEALQKHKNGTLFHCQKIENKK